MSFPQLVYRCPGPHFAHDGQTYEYARVDDAASLSDMIKSGWHESLPEAVENVTASSHDNDSEDGDDFDRAELEEMAVSLGIKFDGRTTDAALLRKITAASGGQ